MLEHLQYDHPAKVFRDVRFVLLGFDPINKPMVLSKLVDGGGVDVGQYGPICTHVIADKLLYDDPICVAARSDGKTLVNGLWVAHSFDVGMPVDPTSVMYRPLRDLKGIPGAKSLVVCLTGYQRQDREDIMTMVSLMGANFSKPLVASKVTHLICYKFEGEKYELAKKMKKIKLVNHLWLEDCLKAWEILPEADYDKSGYELEVLEAEAKDSVEETDIASKHYELLNPNQELRRNQLDSSASKGWSNVINTNDKVSATGYKRISDQDPCHPEVFDSRDARAFGNVSCSEPVKTYERTAVPVTVRNDFASTSGNERSPHSDARKLSPKSYSRKTMYLGGMAGNLGNAPTVNTGNYNVNYGFEISSMTEKLKDGTDINWFRSPKGTVLCPEEQSTILDEKRKMNVSCGNSKSQKTGHNSEAHISAGSMEMTRGELVQSASLISGPVETSNRLFSNNDAYYSSLAAALNTPQRSSATISKLMSSSVGRKSPTSGTPFSKTVNSEIRQDGKLEEALQINSAGSNKDSLGSKLVSEDVAPGEAPKLSFPRSKRLEIEKSNDTPNQSLHADACLKPPTRKMFGRKSWSKGNTTNLKGSIYLNKSVSEDDPAINSIAGHEKLEVVPPTVNLTVLVAPTNDVSQSRNKIQQHSMSMDDETEAPEDNEENEVREAVSEEKYGEDEPDIIGEDDKSEDQQTNETDGNALGVHSHNTTVGKDKDGTKQQKDTRGKTRLGESTHMQKVAKENISKGKKRPLSKINKTTVPSKVPEAREVPEAVSEENYGVVEAEIIGVEKAFGGHSHKVSAEEKDGTKQKKATCGKRKLGESPHTEKAVKENISRGGKRPPSKIKKTTIPSEVLDGKEENEVPGVLCEEKYGEVEPDIVGNVGAEDKSEEVQTYKTDCNALGVHTHKTSGEDKDGTKQKKTTCSKRKLGQSMRMEDLVKEKKNAGGKRPLSKIREGMGLSVKIAAIEEAESEKNEGRAPHPAGKTKRTRSLNELTQSVEVEKENMAICAGDQNVSCGKKRVGKLASKASRKIDTEASKSNLDKVQVQTAPKPEPVWFILSGHKLQRKEFQQVIRRLKGKVCKVSHQWSYQATHFIVPDPVRRTEKFFAAAASGRWILKTDYLSASNREGKFLAEEPYEWYKSGLSEDGAINLEAPRKWRLQRERTGHGAFYKMSIIIYGECISPSLDTLKRVVKAGDGTILATSPPYTRFLESGVDFAVVSPGMPCVDMWVQEFLRHEIPCVVADYLVEFVSKPGYSLERHVQYNTHAWAEKAFKNLVKQSEEIVGLMTPPNDDGGGSDLPCHELVTPPNDCSDSDDLPCQVCGSRDRGEEMLICGDESGSTGCGIGMHIDCCDPPLADVPEEDWFCPSCSENISSMKPPKSAKKGIPVSKRK